MKLVKTKLGKYSFWYRKGDKVIGERISLRKYERFETYLIKNLSRKSGVAVDIGANIGYYSLILSSLVKKVISFEPEPLNFSLLVKNIAENGILNIKTFKKAVSDKKEKLKLGLSVSNLGDHQITTSSTNRKLVSVQSTSVDFSVAEKVSIIKIDTQGWEPKVVFGARRTIERDKPTIFMEFWPDGYARSGLDYMKMVKFLEGIYGKIYLIDDRLNLVYSVSKYDLVEKCKNDKGYVDLLFKDSLSLSDIWVCVKKFRLRRYLAQFLKRFKSRGSSQF